MNTLNKISLLLACFFIAGTAMAGPDFVLLKQARKNQLERERLEKHAQQAALAAKRAEAPASAQK